MTLESIALGPFSSIMRVRERNCTYLQVTAHLAAKRGFVRISHAEFSAISRFPGVPRASAEGKGDPRTFGTVCGASRRELQHQQHQVQVGSRV